MNSEREIIEKLRSINSGILPVEDVDTKTIIRPEHHPVSTSNKPNIQDSEGSSGSPE